MTAVECLNKIPIYDTNGLSLHVILDMYDTLTMHTNSVPWNNRIVIGEIDNQMANQNDNNNTSYFTNTKWSDQYID